MIKTILITVLWLSSGLMFGMDNDKNEWPYPGGRPSILKKRRQARRWSPCDPIAHQGRSVGQSGQNNQQGRISLRCDEVLPSLTDLLVQQTASTQQTAPVQQFIVPVDEMNDVLRNAISTMGEPTNGQGIIVPAGSIIKVMGDIHGDWEALKHNYVQWRNQGIFEDGDEWLLKPNCYIIFTGDYGDRGPLSVKVYRFLACLKASNPDKVFLLRGNHECEWLASFSQNGMQCLHDEMAPYGSETWGLIQEFWRRLPAVLLVGTKAQGSDFYSFIQFCHGGISPYFSPLEKYESIIQGNGRPVSFEVVMLPEDENDGLLWSDFCADNIPVGAPLMRTPNAKKISQSDRGEGCHKYNTSAARDYLGNNRKQIGSSVCSLDAIIRGHEHAQPFGAGGVPLSAARLVDYTHQGASWKPLTHGMSYDISTVAPVITFISSPEGVRTDAYTFGTLHATPWGRWYLIPYIHPIRQMP